MSELLRDLYVKPVDRPIEGVIKADDDASLRQELEEYVITNEIAKKMERFLDAYNDYQKANGAWISGLFGSGKSHLLKMLALLLENRGIDGVAAFELFKDKQELKDNAILSGALRKAIAIPSKSILFNIDQKADVISKQQVDALLAVFQKVFDETCGYYGKQAHIAQFERDLDSRGILDTFKVAYGGIAGRAWEQGREQALLEGKNIASAYAEAAGTDAAEADGLLKRYREDFKLSIEDFAEKVKAHIDAHEPGFRLNFFVDEVGQYIADNTKLMTNLQTIAESLATKCGGRAWVIVTAQQDMGKVIGDMTKQQENDFTKIQARFANRLPLNSADVAEVIQKRLLEKTDGARAQLADLYAREVNNLRTLFGFTDGSIKLNEFRDTAHFVQCYPFIPYQFDLFQMAIQELSQHNAFEGRHSSVGERSMLGVFREAAIHLADRMSGEVATFDAMFEGIRTALKANAQQSILLAERNLGAPIAVRVLKALLLVKYVRPFKATIHNIAVLMTDRFDADLQAHRKQVEEALNLLEQNTYIQRNGELFEFLTDEEKDVEQEIKAVDIDQSEIAKELEALVFDLIIKHRKLKHEKSGQEFSYTRKLDDRAMGREYELSINVVTPLHADSNDADATRFRSADKDELTVLLPSDARFMADLRNYKQTDKYVRQTRSNSQLATVERIINIRAEQNTSRHKELATRTAALITDARLFVKGTELNNKSDDAQSRILRGFQHVVDKVHSNLGMLRGASYAESDIVKHLRNDGGLFDADSAPSEPETEILNFIQRNAGQGLRTTVNSVNDCFERKPYGWSYAAILCQIANLIARGKVEAKLDSAPLAPAQLERDIKNSQKSASITLEVQRDYSPAQFRKLTEFYKDFFDSPPAATDAKALGIETGRKLDERRKKLERLQQDRRHYPFLAALDPMTKAIEEVAGKSYGWYFDELPGHADALLDLKEDVLDPIQRFMNGSQRAIYDEASTFLARHKDNFDDIDGDDAIQLQATLDDPNCFKGNAIQSLKGRLEQLQRAVEARLVAERESACTTIHESRRKLQGMSDYANLDDEARCEVDGSVDGVLAAIDRDEVIAKIRDRITRFQNITYPRLISHISAPPPQPVSAPESKPGSNAPPPQTARPPVYMPLANIRIDFAGTHLASDSDVETYVGRLRDKLKQAIAEGKRITV